MTDPAAMEGMMGMMKGNMAMMIPQTLIMGWINAFFAGFVVRTSPLPTLISMLCISLWVFWSLEWEGLSLAGKQHYQLSIRVFWRMSSNGWEKVLILYQSSSPSH